MEAILNLSNFVQNYSWVAYATSLLVNHIMQAIFFSITVSYLIVMMLKLINFAYAQTVAQSYIVKIIALLAMWYLKIWDHYSGVVYIASVFALAILSIYVYDCCGNISEQFDNWRIHNRDWAIIASFAFMFASTAFVFYSIYGNSLKYDYSGIYLLMVFLILVGNMIRGRSVIYTLIGILTMNYLVGSRYVIGNKVEDTIFAQVPFAVVPYFMMALQAQKRQRQKCNSQTFSNVFMVCAALSAYSLLNDNKFPIELLLGGVFIFGIIINR